MYDKQVQKDYEGVHLNYSLTNVPDYLNAFVLVVREAEWYLCKPARIFIFSEKNKGIL